jgi:hypothetical protein
MLMLAVLLTACGSDDDDPEPTDEPAPPTTQPTATESEPAIVSTPAPSPTIATPGGVASPVAQASPAGIASPAAIATPVASPDALATPAGAIVPVAGEDIVNADGTPVAMRTLYGTVTLPGTINQDFVVSETGCAGLGAFSSVRAGQQLVVRDEDGGIAGVTELVASDNAETCAWTFQLEVPESDFYAVAIPMVTERVYTHAEIVHSEGEIVLSLP